MTKNPKAKMFNKKALDPKNKPDEILKVLGLQPNQKVADIGVGGGYFTLQFAQTVGKDGQVFAVDTNREFLDFVTSSAEENKLYNIKPILVESDKPILLEESVDLIFMRNVSHHLTNRIERFKQLKKALKTNGRFAIIEYRSNGHFSFHKLFGHYVPKETLIKEMTEAGYHLEKDFDFLPEQSFTIFST